MRVLDVCVCQTTADGKPLARLGPFARLGFAELPAEGAHP